jgi:hypothetical protein
MPEELCNRGLTKLPLALPIFPEHFGGRPKVHPYTTQTISSILLTVVYCTANVKFSNSNYSKKKTPWMMRSEGLLMSSSPSKSCQFCPSFSNSGSPTRAFLSSSS